MRILFLISGSLRTFRENVQQFKLNHDFAIFVTRNDTDTYFNPHDHQFLFEDSRFKYVIMEMLPEIPNSYVDERQQNMFKQWYKLHRLIHCVPTDYDLYIRIRPDVYLSNVNEFYKLLETVPKGLRIPQGNDRGGLNDQIAIGDYSSMLHYCDMFHCLNPTLISEVNLQQYLQLPIERVSISYKLILSNAKVIAIAGDSGSGKTTFCQLIRPFFLFDKVLEFETDRYHKWERGNEHWKQISHLHPEANYLEKLEEDTFNLKIGNAVVSVDYDHSTGKFTAPQTIEPKENILLCGLHTMYSKHLRNLTDLKIYIDTIDELKLEWKLERDVKQRGHTPNTVYKAIEDRKHDYNSFISPQKDYADIVVQLHTQQLVLYYQTNLSYQWAREFPCEIHGHTVIFSDPTIDVRKSINRFIVTLDLPYVEGQIGFNGVLQLMFLRALYTKHG